MDNDTGRISEGSLTRFSGHLICSVAAAGEESTSCQLPIGEEFRRRAVDLARQPGASVIRIAADLGISESCLRRWMKLDDVDTGRVDGLTSTERAELVQLRRDKKRLETEVEILKRASAYFARENILPK